MRRALTLAKRGAGRVSPNPMVGCVLVKGGRIIGEGYHARFGGPHAEPAALRGAGARARGCTAYVSLEPCCHRGKTPPCTESLIRAGVRRVVAAMRDPNPRVAGRGLKALRSAGISVVLGVLQDEARDINRAFLSWVTRGRPYVVLKAGTSLDGRIETAAKRSKWITSPEARALNRRMRAEFDAILVGAGTVLADDPRLTASPESRSPARVVLDSRLRTPPRSKVLTGPGRTILVAARPGKKDSPRALGRTVLSRYGETRPEFLFVSGGREGLDLGQTLRGLAKLGVASVLVEGGSAVHTSFLESGLVDEARLFMAPRLLGGEGARTFFEGRGFGRITAAPRLENVSVRRAGPDILITGRICGRKKRRS